MPTLTIFGRFSLATRCGAVVSKFPTALVTEPIMTDSYPQGHIHFQFGSRVLPKPQVIERLKSSRPLNRGQKNCWELFGIFIRLTYCQTFQLRPRLATRRFSLPLSQVRDISLHCPNNFTPRTVRSPISPPHHSSTCTFPHHFDCKLILVGWQ